MPETRAQKPISTVVSAMPRSRPRASSVCYLMPPRIFTAKHATTRAARKTAGSFEKALRNTIENQPYTAVVIALGLGWLFGRMRRPL